MTVLAESSIVDAARWLTNLTNSQFSVSIATISLAFLGAGMLGGHVSQRAAFRTLVGMFVLFGAPAISDGLMRSARGDGQGAGSGSPSVVSAPLLPARVPDFDPYAGAVAPVGR